MKNFNNNNKMLNRVISFLLGHYHQSARPLLLHTRSSRFNLQLGVSSCSTAVSACCTVACDVQVPQTLGPVPIPASVADLPDVKLGTGPLQHLPLRRKRCVPSTSNAVSQRNEKQLPLLIPADAIVKRPCELGFDKSTLDLLTLNRRTPFLDQWLKVDLFLKEGFTPVQVEQLVTERFLSISYTKFYELFNILKYLGLTGEAAAKALGRNKFRLGMGIGNLKNKINYLQDLGACRKTLSRIMTTHPRILGLSFESLQKRIDFLKDLGAGKKDISAIICRHVQILGLNFENNVKPKVALIESMGVSRKTILMCLIRSPRSLDQRIEIISERLNFLAQLGFLRDSRVFSKVWLEWCTTPCEIIQSKMGLILSYGFSQSECEQMLKTLPTILHLSEQTLSKKFDYLFNVLNRDTKEIVRFPQFMSYSLENRIIPRFKVIADLEKKGLIRKDISLNTVLCYTDENFQIHICNRYSKTDVKIL